MQDICSAREVKSLEKLSRVKPGKDGERHKKHRRFAIADWLSAEVEAAEWKGAKERDG